jgi:hypothetical protein
MTSTIMSEQAIEFLEEWISEKVQRPQPVPTPAPLEKQAEILCLKCQADAAKAGVPLDEIVEEVGDLEDLIAAKLEDAEQASGERLPAHERSPGAYSATASRAVHDKEPR